MKTLVIDDEVMHRVKQEAARQGCTASELVEAALRLMLDKQRTEAEDLPPLPVFNGGKAQVDISDREALYDTMEGRRGSGNL